jgi:hypothetical protein
MEVRSPEVRSFFDWKRNEIVMSAGGKDSVEPGLFVLMAWGCEGGSRELFGIKTKGRFLRRITKCRERAYRDSQAIERKVKLASLTFYGFSFMVATESVLSQSQPPNSANLE